MTPERQTSRNPLSQFSQRITSLLMLVLTTTFLTLSLSGCGQSSDNNKASSGDQKTAATTTKPQTWRFALEETKGGVQWAYAQKFKKLIEKKTDGKVKVTIYPYGTLGSSQDITQQVQNNAVQLAFASAGHVGSTIPEAQVFTLHFLFAHDNKVNEKIFSSNPTVYKLLGEAYNEHQLKLLAIVPEGWMVWSTNSPIHKPSDFDGVKIRVKPSPLLLDTYKAYGAIPKPMAYSEIYGALQRGQIDAETQPMFAIRDMSFYEVQKYLVEAHNAQFVTTLITSPGFFNKLSPKIQQDVLEVKKELDPYIFKEQAKLNAAATKEIKKKSDIQFIKLTPEETAVFAAKVKPIFAKYEELAGERGKKILAAIREAVQQSDSGS